MSTPVRGGRGVGRPRVQGPSRSGLAPRAEVLLAAAQLFTTRGYSTTSTRAVAEAAGLRQASLYHYFASKDDILAALLEGTVQPSLVLARRLTGQDSELAQVRLWALCRADAALLGGGPHNLGALYLLPEVRAERFAAFHRGRAELRQAYRDLFYATGPGGRLSPAERLLRADLVFGLVESVILMRRERTDHDAGALPEATADAALRLAGYPEAELPAVRVGARALLLSAQTDD